MMHTDPHPSLWQFACGFLALAAGHALVWLIGNDEEHPATGVRL